VLTYRRPRRVNREAELKALSAVRSGTLLCLIFMTEKQYKVERSKLDVRDSESKVREAQRNLDEGYKKALAQVEQAKADMERDYSRLKEELERAKIRLDVEKTYLQFAEAELARGYEA
jgi:multidrug resistance efflux pump